MDHESTSCGFHGWIMQARFLCQGMGDKLINPRPHVVIERIPGVTSKVLINYWIHKAHASISMAPIHLGILK